ncbi:MAG TPA: protoporphyrinogen oxidase [Mycobacteriales bacterium]|nr:protoporphyrinogen oxidase [Mycobacteriales bacterium]
MSDAPVAVIGGGIAGLAAADVLAREGIAVTVLEGAPEVGGKLRTTEVGGIPVDEGAEAVLVRRPEALELFAALGLDTEQVAPRTAKAAVWARGELRPMPPRTVMGLPSDPAALRGVLSAAEVARARADAWLPGRPPGDDDIAVGVWARKRFGSAVVDRLLDPLLGGVYAGRADDLSLAATLPQVPRDERSALRAVRRAVPSSPPSDQPVFATLRRGLGTLPAALAASVGGNGGRVELGAVVRAVERTPSGWRVVYGATTAERALEADAVVVATPARPASKLLATVAPTAATELATIESASMAIVTTAWRAEDAGRGDISGYLVPATSGRPVKAVTLSWAKWPHLSAGGVVVARCSLGRHGDTAVLQRDDAELVADAAAELTAYAGFSGRPIDARVSRWGGALPQYAVGHLDRVRRIRSAVEAQPGLAVCGATYDGVGIPACIGTGQRAARQVLSYLRSLESR